MKTQNIHLLEVLVEGSLNKAFSTLCSILRERWIHILSFYNYHANTKLYFIIAW